MVGLVAPVSYGSQGDEARPLPTIDSVLERVAEQAKKEGEIEREFKQHYSYKRSKETVYRNADGDVKKRVAKTGTRIPKPTTIASVSEPSKTRTQAARSPNDNRFTEKDRAFEKSDFELAGELFDRFDFTLIGREIVDGRSALVVDFKPVEKDLPEHGIKDKFINRAAGRVWVDEEDYALVKADLHLTDRVNVIGGLVGAVWKFHYDFLRKRTDDGLWFSSAVNWHLEGRELFFRRTIDYHEENTDVKRVWFFDSVAK